MLKTSVLPLPEVRVDRKEEGIDDWALVHEYIHRGCL